MFFVIVWVEMIPILLGFIYIFFDFGIMEIVNGAWVNIRADFGNGFYSLPEVRFIFWDFGFVFVSSFHERT